MSRWAGAASLTSPAVLRTVAECAIPCSIGLVRSGPPYDVNLDHATIQFTTLSK